MIRLTSASSAVGIIYSAMALIQAFAFMIGQGAGNQISQLLGKGQEEEAKKYASVAWFTGFGIGIVVAVLGMTKMEAIVMLLGSTQTIAPYAVDYARYIFLAAPFMICSFIMNNLLRFQGLAVYSMVGITIGGILNIVLDPILIFGVGLGTMGAGIATGFSQLVSFCILLLMCNMFSQSIGYGFRSSIISCARQGLFLIPILAILPHLLGLRGLQLAQPISDVFAFILAIVLTRGIMREFNKK